MPMATGESSPARSASSPRATPSRPQPSEPDIASTPLEMSQLQRPRLETEDSSMPETPTVFVDAPTEQPHNTDSTAADESRDTDMEKSATPPTVVPAAISPNAAADEPQSTAEEQGAISRPQDTSSRRMERRETNPIGPAQETMPVLSADPANGPVVLITLLLITGARHPFRIDERYLKKRNIPNNVRSVDGAEDKVDPWEISVYTVKELIWRDWRDEWEARPSSPSSIRLIHLGRLLDDKVALKDCRLHFTNTNVVHMTIKPSDFGDDDEQAAKGGKSSSRHERDGERESVGLCRCVIL